MKKGIVKTGHKSKKEYEILGINPPLFGVHGGLLIVAHRKKTYSCELDKIYPTSLGFLRYDGKFKKTLREQKVPKAQPVQGSTLF